MDATTNAPPLATQADLEAVKTRMHLLADKVGVIELEQAKLGARVVSSEESIDRLRQSSATAEQLGSATTILALKLDHLLEKHVDMKKQITWAVRLVAFCVLCGIAALLYTSLMK